MNTKWSSVKSAKLQLNRSGAQSKTGSGNRQKQQRRNEASNTGCDLRFHLRSTVQVPEVKVYRGTSDLLGVALHCVAIFKLNRSIPNSTFKGSLQSVAEGQRSVQDKVDYVAYHSIGSDLATILVPFSFVYHTWFKRYRQIFSNCLIMRVVKNWPDLRS